VDGKTEHVVGESGRGVISANGCTKNAIDFIRGSNSSFSLRLMTIFPNPNEVIILCLPSASTQRGVTILNRGSLNIQRCRNGFPVLFYPIGLVITST
jgi:hypothetical protein